MYTSCRRRNFGVHCRTEVVVDVTDGPCLPNPSTSPRDLGRRISQEAVIEGVFGVIHATASYDGTLMIVLSSGEPFKSTNLLHLYTMG